MTILAERLDRLARFEPNGFPVVSVYLDARPDQHGSASTDDVRRELAARVNSFEPRSAERESYERDVERITAWLDTALEPSANGVAIFACAAADDFFEAVQLEAPVEASRVFVYDQPHLYELARLNDALPRYAVVLLDSNSARIFVAELGAVVNEEEVAGVEKTKRHKAGGWSQARYQRHVDNLRQQHAREIVERLEQLVRKEDVKHILLAGDEVIIPIIRAELTQALEALVVEETLRLDITTSVQEVLERSLAAMKVVDAATDAEKVQRLFEAWRSGSGLGVVGVEDTLEALTRGQVDELFLTTTLPDEHPEPTRVDPAVLPDTVNPDGSIEHREIDIADELVTLARKTDATVTFIEHTALLADVGGVGALLRFSLR